MRILLATWLDPKDGEERTVALGDLHVPTPESASPNDKKIEPASIPCLPQICSLADIHTKIKRELKSSGGDYSISTSCLDTDFELQCDADFHMFAALVTSKGTNTANVRVHFRPMSRPTTMTSSNSIFTSRIEFKEYTPKQDEVSSFFKNDSLKSLEPLLGSDPERLKMSDLEDSLLRASIDLTLWKRHSFKHEKTLEALFDNIKAGMVELYKEGDTVVQVRHYVRVKVRHRESGLILLKVHEFSKGKNKRDVNDILKFRCSKHQAPFLTALEGVQRELGHNLWGAEGTTASEDCEPNESTPENDFSKVLRYVRPVGFDLPRTEMHPSSAYPQTDVLEYIDTLEVIWNFTGVPASGSFTTVDEGKGTVHLWQWENEESLDYENKEVAVEAEVHGQVEDHPYSIMSRFLGKKSSRFRQDYEAQSKPETPIKDLPPTDKLTEGELNSWLSYYEVDTESWGQGGSKKLSKLVEEIKSHEAELVLVKDSSPSSTLDIRPLRRLRVAKVQLVQKDAPELMLIETHQQLQDGSKRIRYKTLSEKFQPDDAHPWDVALRGTYEEIFVSHLYSVDTKDVLVNRSAISRGQGVTLVDMLAPELETEMSPSYPGLLTEYVLHKFVCLVDLPRQAFCTKEQVPDGVITHFWDWKTFEETEDMNTSLVRQIQFYLQLTNNSMDQVFLQNNLVKAATANDTNAIDYIIDVCFTGNALSLLAVGDKGNDSALRLAAIKGAKGAVELMIRKILAAPNCQPLQEDSHKCTLLYYAALSDCESLVEDMCMAYSSTINSVCLHSCIYYRANRSLKVVISKLRLHQYSREIRHVLGKPPVDNFISPPCAADNLEYFRSLVSHASSIINDTSNTKAVRDDAHTSLGLVLQHCRPTDRFYKKSLKLYLQILLGGIDLGAETAKLEEFVLGSIYPIHAAIVCVECLPHVNPRKAPGLLRVFDHDRAKCVETLEQLVCDILDSCSNQYEADSLLLERADIPAWYYYNGKPVSLALGNRNQSTSAHLSLGLNLRKIVGHKFFITQNDDVWFVNKSDSIYTWGPGSSSYWIIKTVYRCVASLLLFTLLIIVLPVLFITPFSPRLRVILDITRTEFHCCYFKWTAHLLSYVIFLWTLVLVAQQPDAELQGINGLKWADYVLLVIILANVVSVIERVLAGFPFAWGLTTERALDFLSHTMLLLGYAAAIFLGVDRLVKNTFFALGTLLAIFRILPFFSHSKTMGPLWATLKHVWQDVLRFGVLASVVTIAFIYAFAFLLKGEHVEGFRTPYDTFLSLVWAMFDGSNRMANVDMQIFQVFVILFLLLASLLLTNLLIAMMTDQYNYIKREAHLEWRYSVAHTVEKYTNMPLVPPPFNLFVLPSVLLFRACNSQVSLYEPLEVGDSARMFALFPLSPNKKVVPATRSASKKKSGLELRMLRKHRAESASIGHRTVRKRVLKSYLAASRPELLNRVQN